MSVEGSLVRPESSMGPREEERGANSTTEGIPEWSLNVQTYQLLHEGHCTYNAAEQSLVWPPMLLMCSVAMKDLEYDLMGLRATLAMEGMQANSVEETKHVCCEGNTTFHLFVLPPSGLSFAAAKAVDCARGLGFHVFYPSLKDMLDIKNGRLPEFPRRIVKGLNYHGRPREAWINLGVDLVCDDGTCVGRGVCQKFEAMDSVDEEALGEFYVGVRVLEVLKDDLLPSHWKGSLRRWRATHVLYNGVSLFECLRQHMHDESKVRFCKDGSIPARVAEVLRDQCISSVFPWTSILKDSNEFNHLSATYAITCRDAIDEIEKNTLKSDSEGPILHDQKLFATKLDIDESLRKEGIKKIAKDTSQKRLWTKHLGTINSSHMARDVVKRLTVLQKLAAPATSSTLISPMIKRAEEMEIRLLNSLRKVVPHENRQKMEMANFDEEMESFILLQRREQHNELLQELANMNARHFSKMDGIVLGKFKFLDSFGRIMKETESVQQWLVHHIAKATSEEKKKWEDEAAKARMEEQKKWEEQLAKARMEEQKKCEEQAAKARIEEQEKWEEQLAKARTEQRKCEKVSAKVMAELAIARQELEDQKEAMPKCAICFEGLEVNGTKAKCGKKRSRQNDVVQRKRACFTPCMHSSMCLDCAMVAWEKFKRCPVCSTPCSSKPQPIFM